MADTTKRRELKFANLDEMLADAKTLAEAAEAEKVTSVGEWNPAQAIMHIALNMRFSMDGGMNNKRSLFTKILAGFIKRSIFKKGMKPGVKIPEKVARIMVPKPKTKPGSAFDALERQTERMKECQEFQPHLFFGELTRDEWIQLTLRHAELHFSFHHINE